VREARRELADEGVAKALGFTSMARHNVVRDLFADGRRETVQLVTNRLHAEAEMDARRAALSHYWGFFCQRNNIAKRLG
jgi:hypothetical protein